MNDLIRRDEILAKECCGRISANDIRQAPAVDAVEVVRCEKCKHWEPQDNGRWMSKGRTDGACRMLLDIHCSARYMTEKDHFCSYGERRE